ncbi:ribulose-phosphate 3-epimerase [Chitinivibrio alkaliphilus]|uniref:Ribulose-phosphate 3-epimerase n=1 Tax=Chitinivibrio alkaliphilus ACht1 TaxID=1313304 RepID=U7DA82_9BACT|nr:ribulose-phosphate 3-epimerase [Chitinivibrio alkaliphilus]ERP39299.1 ribulose-phosphate 3-epimerase [Chitinivibrio alkaliphilus ACht1]
MRSPLISPSILSADFAHLSKDIHDIDNAGADWIHCDVMDGMFVPNISFGPMIIEKVHTLTDKPLDVHLMVTQPERYLEAFAAAGAHYITVHANACQDLPETLDKIASLGCKAGVSVNPDIPISTFTDYLDKIDLVLLMSVYAGFGGQSFLPEVLEKISAVKALVDKMNHPIHIEVDGGITDKTGRLCVEQGADVLVAGSYIFKQRSYQNAIDSLRIS